MLIPFGVIQKLHTKVVLEEKKVVKLSATYFQPKNYLVPKIIGPIEQIQIFNGGKMTALTVRSYWCILELSIKRLSLSGKSWHVLGYVFLVFK